MKLLRFTASYCLFCLPVAALVERLAGEHNLVVEVVDCSKGNKVADKYKIQALPTVLFVTDLGQVLAQVAGAQPAKAFLDALKAAKAKEAKLAKKRATAAGKKFRKARRG
jgi:thioredoxin-like negative regulator of GroEL